MERQNFILAPLALASKEFRCKVPLQDSKQLFLINGVEQRTKEPFSFNLKEGETMQEILQIISVRNHEDKPIVGPCTGPMASTSSVATAPLDINNNFLFEKSSSGKIVLCSHTFSLDHFITNERVTICLEEDSSADFVLMQNEHNEAQHTTTFDIKMARGASLNMVFLSLHGGKIINNISVSLDGPNARCNLSGLYLVDGTQVVENNINLVHNAPKCLSNQLFKGILDDKSIGRFYGLINVVPDAQKTEAYQANHNLLISNGAKIYSQPQLEIYADDVKCSHGATIGRLDQEELFYMRSRGISFKEAKLLQQLAFAFAVLEKITNDALRERMYALVEKRLRGEFSNCKNCSKNCC